MAGTAETLVRNGDGDDYVRVGTFALEAYANGLDLSDVSGARRHEDEQPRAYPVIPAAGFLAVHKQMPVINRF